MNNQFLITFDSMPRGTAQMKRYNSYTRTYFKSKALQETHKQFALALKPYRPKKPSEAPIKLCIWLAFDIKSPRRLWGTWKTTKPDCDNYVKEFIDVMTELGWWKDDAQVVDLRIRKTYAEKASIFVQWEELKETGMRLIDADALREDFKSRLAECNEWIEKAKDKETKIRASAVKAFIAEVIMTIDDAPTVDLWEMRQEATENALKKAEVLYKRPQGKWIKIFSNPFTDGYICSICGHKIQVTEQFLPKVTECEVCGADMRGDTDETD